MYAISDDRTDDLNFYSLLAVLQTGMWLHADFEEFLRPHGLSQGRFSILLSLSHSPDGELYGNQLAIQLGVAKPTITKMVKTLGRDGYITVRTDSKDSRKKRYALTGRSVELLARIIPPYVERMREMATRLSAGDKTSLIALLSGIDFSDPRKTIFTGRTKSITEKGYEIRRLCARGTGEDIDAVIAYLNATVDIPTTKLVDFYLGTVTNPDGIRRIEHYLFNGTQIQRNYSTLFFSRKKEWDLVNRAYEMGLIDRTQAYSR